MATAKKSGKKAAKKSAASTRRTPSKTTRAAKTAPRSPGRTRDAVPPVWIPGTLDVVGGKIGLQTDLGFIPLEDVAAYGQALGLVFQPAGGEDGEARTVKLAALTAFIEAYGLAAITGVVTTCRGGGGGGGGGGG